MSAIPTSFTSLIFSLTYFIVYGSVFEAQVHKDVWTHTEGLQAQNAPTIILPVNLLLFPYLSLALSCICLLLMGYYYYQAYLGTSLFSQLRTLATRVSADSCTFVTQLESIIGGIKDIDGRIDDQDEHLIAILSRIVSLEREKVTGGKYRECTRKECWRLGQLADDLEARLRSDIADILESQLDEHRSAARKDILKLRDSTARHLKLVDERARAVEAELWARLEESEVTRLADY